MTRKIFTHAKKILPFIGIAILIYIVFSLDLGEIKDDILSIHPSYIAIALSLTIPRLILRNYAWQLIQKEHKIKLSYFQSLKIFLIGYFYGNITPGYIGQLMRIPYMKEKTKQPYGKLFVNTTIETIVHTLSLYGMMFIGALFVIQTLPQVFQVTLAWIIILAITLIFFIKKERGEKLFNFLIKLLIPKKLKEYSNRFVGTFYNDFPKIRNLIPPFVIGIFTWVIIFTQEYIIVFALGLDIPYLYFLLLFPIANVAGFIPITFGGLGTRELTAILLFSTIFAISQESVFVFTLLGFVITDVVTALVGFILSLTEARTKITW